jgi:LCP family protein required for cell wall assembly
LTRWIGADTLPLVSDASRASAPRSTRGQRALIGLAIVAFAAISAYLALVILTRLDSFSGQQITIPGPVGGVLPGVDTEGESQILTERINILVLGVDRRPHEGELPGRTDTMFIMTVDPKTESAKIVGIPRDLLVEYPAPGGGTIEDRINTIYFTGEEGGYEGGGIGLLKAFLKQEWDIDIHRYVIIDFEVVEAVYDPYYSRTELPGDYFPVDFEPGVHHMDGATALAYARVRFSSDDLDRIQRQQRVIFATLEKARSLNVFDVTKAAELWAQYKDTIETDVSDFYIPQYARLAAEVQDNLIAISIGPATTPYTTRQGASVLIGDDESIQEIMDSVFKDAPISGAPVVEGEREPVAIEVQNGAGIDGLAARVVAYLATKPGMSLEDLSSDNVFDGVPHQMSEIIDVDGTNRQTANSVAKYLGIPVERVRTATAAEQATLSAGGADLVVILGSDVDFDALIQADAAAGQTGG